VLRALESICNDAGFSTKHKMVLMSESNRRADIQVLNIRVAQMTDLLVDVSLRQREREREKRQERDRERETERERARNGAIAPNPPEPAAASTRVWGGKEARHLQPGSRSRQQRHCRPTPLRARNDFIGAGRDGWRTHGRLRNPDNPDQILESAAAQKIRDYRSTYRRDRQVDFLPACMSTSGRHAFFSEVDMHFSCACSSIHRGFGRIHGEFLRLLFFLANRKTDDYFEALGYQPHKQDFCHRRSAFFQQNWCTIGMAFALAVAIRGAPTTARRHVAAPRDLPPLNMAYDEYDRNVSHVNGVA
jgi:hypothetical protein